MLEAPWPTTTQQTPFMADTSWNLQMGFGLDEAKAALTKAKNENM
jgi:hypothetical protein